MDATPATALSPEADGFVPPWAEWDFNEWETCTDTDLLGVRRACVKTFSKKCLVNLSIVPCMHRKGLG